MNAFVYHFRFEFRTSFRNRAKLSVNYLLPLGLYVMMGLIMAPIVPGFRETMIPAMVGVAILAATTLSRPVRRASFVVIRSIVSRPFQFWSSRQ